MIEFTLDCKNPRHVFDVRNYPLNDTQDPFSLIDLENEPQQIVDHINRAVGEIFAARKLIEDRNESVVFNIKRAHNQTWEMTPQNLIAVQLAMTFNYLMNYGYGKGVDVKCDFNTSTQLYPALWWFITSILKSIDSRMRPEWVDKIFGLNLACGFFSTEKNIEFSVCALALHLMGYADSPNEADTEPNVGTIQIPKELVE